MRYTSMAAACAVCWAGVSAAADTPEPVDFLDYGGIETVALSPDGERVLIETRRADPEANAFVDRFWLVDADGDSEPVELALPEGARSVDWHPDGERLVMLAPPGEGQAPQVLAGAPAGGDFAALTGAPGGVSDFELGPGGNPVVYTTREPAGQPEPENDDGRRGVSVDVESFSKVKLLRGELEQHDKHDARRMPHARLWIQAEGPDSAEPVVEEMHVERFALGPDGERVALTTLDEPGPAGQRPSEGADLRVYGIDSEELHTVREGSDGIDDNPLDGRVAHSAPFWSPSGERLVFLRTDHSYGMASVADLGVHDFASGETWFPVRAEERELGARRIRWRDEDTLLVERVGEARHGLYTLGIEDGTLEPMRVSDASHHDFSFVDGGQRAAWVEQSTARPPEVYVGDPATEEGRQVTDFNAHQAGLSLPEAEAVSWTSTDGTEVSGWLLMPEGASADDPAPLLTFLAGGPSFVVTNRFSLYPRRFWPYPLTQFVSEGYALLVVHYRGTSTFGRDFRQFTLGEESVDDVQAGVEAMAERAAIDGGRLGILGHSHGAGLGPLAADGGPQFEAASFAEGSGNAFSIYLAMEGSRNIHVQEPLFGGTPWEMPERYLEVSPAFQEQLIENTATLIEAGEQAAAGEALQFGKAFWRHGTEHEVVIYPDTGHNIREPELMLESMKRHLEWFESQMAP